MRSLLGSLIAGIAALGLLAAGSSRAAAQPPASANVYSAPAYNLYPGYTGTYQPSYQMPTYNAQTYSYTLPANPYYNGPQYTQGATNYVPVYAYPNSGAISFAGPTNSYVPSYGGVRYPGSIEFMYPTYTGVIHYPGNVNLYFYSPYIIHP